MLSRLPRPLRPIRPVWLTRPKLKRPLWLMRPMRPIRPIKLTRLTRPLSSMRQLWPKARPEAKLWPEARPEARLLSNARLSSISLSVFSMRYVKPSRILDVVDHNSPLQNILQLLWKLKDVFVQLQITINLEAGPWSSMDEIVGTV